jgi:hypothetical protein
MTSAGRVEVRADTRDLFAANVRFYDTLVRGS